MATRSWEYTKWSIIGFDAELKVQSLLTYLLGVLIEVDFLVTSLLKSTDLLLQEHMSY